MYLDHPVITATNSDVESDRVERLNRVYGYAIALADADHNDRCIAKLARIHDHKGNLMVYWWSEPDAVEKQYFMRAWQSLVGDQSEHVVHELETAQP
jgi:hypothetical protein